MSKIIQCKWADKNRFVVNPDGQVWPCCYFANLAYISEKFRELNRRAELYSKNSHMAHPVMVAYMEKKDSMNAKNRPVHEILDDEWFNKTLPESWESEETLHQQCSTMCRVKQNANE